MAKDYIKLVSDSTGSVTQEVSGGNYSFSMQSSSSGSAIAYITSIKYSLNDGLTWTNLFSLTAFDDDINISKSFYVPSCSVRLSTQASGTGFPLTMIFDKAVN